MLVRRFGCRIADEEVEHINRPFQGFHSRWWGGRSWRYIDHGDGVHSIYGHMAGQPSVTVGQTVSRGDTIGQVGSTGLSTGPHVHFMIREDGVTVDPKNYLPPIESAATTAGN